MPITTEILLPVVALVVWSQVMWFWLYATRIPAIRQLRMRMDPDAPQGQQMSTLPPSVRWKADNYNHLMEQPTVFYALAISLALLGEGTGTNVLVAWGYVLLRVVHSLIQATSNNIIRRFAVFALSNIPLLALMFSAIAALL